MKNLKINALAILAILAISSCSKDDEPVKKVEPVNDEELITNVNIVFTPENGGNTVILGWSDSDGVDGPNAPVFAPITNRFKTNKTYNGVVTILDQSKNPVGNVTEEVLKEAADHQIFYIKTGGLPDFTYTPKADAATNYDANGKPVGLQTRFTTATTAGSGSLRIVLKHEGNKSLEGVAAGLFANATGASDFDFIFLGLEVVE